MPINNTQLDNQYPPIFKANYASGKTVGGDAVADIDGTVQDTNTSLRTTEGHDPLNYVRSQRVEGDLFHRDLVIGDIIQKVLNYLGQRQGITLNLPKTRLAADTYVVLGVLQDTQVDKDYDGWFVNAVAAYSSDPTDCSVKVYSGNDLLVTYSASGNYGNIFLTDGLDVSNMAGNPLEDDAFSVVSGSVLEVRFYNEGASEVDASAVVVLSPRVEEILAP